MVLNRAGNFGVCIARPSLNNLNVVWSSRGGPRNASESVGKPEELFIKKVLGDENLRCAKVNADEEVLIFD